MEQERRAQGALLQVRENANSSSFAMREAAHDPRIHHGNRPARPLRGDAGGRAAAAHRAGGGPLDRRDPGGHADQRDDAVVHPQADRDGAGGADRGAVDAAPAGALHHAADREPAGGDPVMTLDVAWLLPWLDRFLWALARVSGLCLLAPVFGASVIPMRVRLGVVVVL